jgi:hypothetical protein
MIDLTRILIECTELQDLMFSECKIDKLAVEGSNLN